MLHTNSSFATLWFNKSSADLLKFLLHCGSDTICHFKGQMSAGLNGISVSIVFCWLSDLKQRCLISHN